MFGLVDTRSQKGLSLRIHESNLVVSDDIDEPANNGRAERLRSLAIAALNLVERAVDNLELFDGK